MLSQKKMKKILLGAFLLTATCYGQAAFAQQTDLPQQEVQQEEKFSETELKQFLQANTKVTTIQKEGQQTMLKLIEEANMDVEQFNKFAQAQREQKLDDIGATPDQLAAFDKAAQQIMEIQPAVKENVKKAIEEEGLTEDQYRAIVTAYQQDEAVKAKVHELMAR
jgi:predicted restriction endonuclease